MSESAADAGGRQVSDNFGEGTAELSVGHGGLLRQILFSAEQAEQVAALQASLRAVARRLGNLPFSEEPVLRELVRSQLEPLRGSAGTSYEAMCLAVSEAIYGDTAARQRAERLWLDLTEGVANAG